MANIAVLLLCSLTLAVGREGVLALSSGGELQCGRRLVSGLFTRPRLPLGYSYITTVPRGACRLNVSEIMSSENYIALRVTNGSFIVNGEFAVSAPGSYDAAGARFIYSRLAGQDSIFSHGPIHQSVDIMVLYTQPNPNIKYEYLIASEEESNDIPNSSKEQHHPRHHHRHHNAEHTRALDAKSNEIKTNTLEFQSQVDNNVIGGRRFFWRILSYTPCSRSCGGGLQIGKFRCVEVTAKESREVSPPHCEGTPPPSRRRRCGANPCPPRWRAAAWSACPVCGPAQRTRIVGCVQDHARGIAKISDQKCPLPMPPNTEPCVIPNCDGSAPTTSTPRADARRQVRPRDKIDNFHAGPVISLATNHSDNDFGSHSLRSYSFSAAGGWLYTDWSECVGWCVGGGVQTRSVKCTDPSGCHERAPSTSQACTVNKMCDAQWFTGEWSQCSAQCSGRQVRAVICFSGNGKKMKETSCHKPKPESERACGGTCSSSWYLSEWTECQGPCGAGVQARTVWCAKGGVDGAAGAARDADCPSPRPLARRNCVPARCSTKPTVRPNFNTAYSNDIQQRVTRHQSHSNTHKPHIRPTTKGECVDKLNNCILAVQARLCNYPYYADSCCMSCHGKGR